MKALIAAVCLLIVHPAPSPQSDVAGRWVWQGAEGWQRIELDLAVAAGVWTGTVRIGVEPVAPGAPLAPEAAWRLFFEPLVIPIRAAKVQGHSISFEHLVSSSARFKNDTFFNDLFVYSGEVTGNRMKLTRRIGQQIDRPSATPSQIEFVMERVP